MLFLHVSDLHIGRRLNGYSLIEEQRHILAQLLDIAESRRIDALLVAGDLYDSNIPTAEAVRLLDWFFTSAIRLGVKIFAIAGNHDSAERLSFGRELMNRQGLHLSAVFSGTPGPCIISDEFGPINIYLLPYLHPAQLRAAYGQSFSSADEALRHALDSLTLSANERNLLLAHQFVTKSGKEPILSDSEVKNVGGIDNIDAAAFERFDYVALGHLHAPAALVKNKIYYSGSPLKYSVSEQHHKKQALLVSLGEKTTPPAIESIPLSPLRDLRQIKGPMDALLKMPPSDDYVSVVLTDESRRIDPMNRFKVIFPNCLSVEYAAELRAEGDDRQTFASGDLSQRTPLQIFEEFYAVRSESALSVEERDYVNELLERLLAPPAESL